MNNYSANSHRLYWKWQHIRWKWRLQFIRPDSKSSSSSIHRYFGMQPHMPGHMVDVGRRVKGKLFSYTAGCWSVCRAHTQHIHNGIQSITYCSNFQKRLIAFLQCPPVVVVVDRPRMDKTPCWCGRSPLAWDDDTMVYRNGRIIILDRRRRRCCCWIGSQAPSRAIVNWQTGQSVWDGSP